MEEFLELSQLQELIAERIGYIEHWVRVEIESHRVSGGHHYLNFIEKTKSGEIAAKAAGRIWRSNAWIVNAFEEQTGEKFEAGITVAVLAVVDYHPQYGISLIIKDIDPNFTIGQRELEKQKTISRLTEEGLMELQHSLALPFLPGRIAVISSDTAAGYGDFLKHLKTNPRGFKFDITLFPSLMQGESCASSIAESLREVEQAGLFDTVIILRGGGADSDMFAYDEYEMCAAIARCSLPVLTAVGHERDFHIADMVSYEHFKTPTAVAGFLIDWTTDIEIQVEDALSDVIAALREKVLNAEMQVKDRIASIKFSLASIISLREKEIALLEAGISAADPRAILRQGYVLAADKDGRILKKASDRRPGDKFSLRFSDGRWDCSIDNVNHGQ